MEQLSGSVRDFLQKCREDIFFYAEYGLGETRLTWQQATLLDQIQCAQFGLPTPLPRIPCSKGPGVYRPGDPELGPAPRQIADKSGQGPGKTHGSVIGVTWRALRSPGKSVVTAPTMRQCQDVWLSEAKKILYNAHPILREFFDIRATKIELGRQREWSIYCITSTDDKKLQGFHDEGLTILGEEASGIPRPIIEQFQGTLSNEDCLLILIGNPNTRDCAFFDAFHSQRGDWQTYTLNAEETAKYRPDILDPRRNERLADEYGRDSDTYRVRVLGEFPSTDPNCVLSYEDLEKCHLNSLYECALSDSYYRSIAIDFARYGGDETVIYRRQGYAIVEQAIYSHIEPLEAVDRAFLMQKECGWANGDVWYVVDASGMGQGALGAFYKAHKQVFEFHNHAKAYRSDIYDNRITEAWFNFRDLVRNRKIYLPNDNRLISQLAGRIYKHNAANDKLQIEPKEQYAKRLEENSPDRGETAIMAFYSGFMTRGQVAPRETKIRKSIFRRKFDPPHRAEDNELQ